MTPNYSPETACDLFDPASVAADLVGVPVDNGYVLKKARALGQVTCRMRVLDMFRALIARFPKHRPLQLVREAERLGMLHDVLKESALTPDPLPDLAPHHKAVTTMTPVFSPASSCPARSSAPYPISECTPAP